MKTAPACLALLAAAAAILLAAEPALAQLVHRSPFAPHPFAVGASEGAVGHQNALGAFMIAQESRFYLALTAAVRASGSAGGALWLVALSFLYGVFHAAGPGHGKAVISSYMLSNEVAVRRGLAIALLAALFQGLVAMLLVGAAVFVFHLTAQRMTAASRWIEVAGYGGIVALGLVLTGRKGAALLRAARGWRRDRRGDRGGLIDRSGLAARMMPAARLAFAAPGGERAEAPRPMLRQGGAFGGGTFWGAASPATPGRFRADDGGTVRADAPHPAGCDCRHMPAPLGDGRLDRRAAALAVVTAGARPCSGAVLVLVFASSQGLFAAGVAATTAMALGTAITTGALAFAAVGAKGLAMRLALRLAGGGSTRAALAGRAFEFAAALAVLGFGAALLGAWVAGAAGMG